MSKKISKKAVVTVLSVVTLGATCMAVAACNGNEPIGYIDAPETLEAELGTYTVPEYDVVDKNGMVLYGYNVRLKSVTGANGATVEITNRAVTVETAGIYDFVYTANSSGVADVTVKIDFADRTPPTINYDENNLPDFFITGNSYRMPAYTISGEFDREKCYAKVYHIATDKTETEVAVESNRFKVEATSGSYAIRIHVEDAVGNEKEYEYVRSVDGPEHYVENKVLYFDEEFGERQVAVYESEKYTGGFVSKDTEGAHVREGENGAYKVSFDGVTETSNNEGYVIMKVPAVVDITDHIELEMYVYNDSDADIKMGSPWWNDTDVKKGEWTRLTWKVDAAGWSDNRQIGSSKVISPVDITGTTIRFIFDYDQQIIPNGDFYLSSMRAVPKQRSAVTAGDNVTLDRPDGAYFVGDTVELSAADVSGKMFDCFFVDGKPIIGNNFVARNDAHSVTAKYVDGALTKDNMTWGVVEEYETVGTDAKAYKLGEGDKWALTYDLYGISGTGWNYFGAYVGGADQLIGIELAGTDKHIALGYGGNWKGMTQIELSDEVTALLRGATDNAPVTAIYVRDGDTIKMLLKSAEKTYFVASWSFDVFEVSGNGFGIGERIGRDGDGNELVNATLKNIKGVAGAERVAAFMQEFKTEITKTNVTTEKDDYYIGDTVTLTAAAAPDGQIFSHFTVDGVRISGNTFTVTKLSYTVVAEYSEISDIEIAGSSGISTADGKTQYARGAFVKLVFDESKAPSGQVFDCFLVDGVKVNGDTFETSKAKHVITAKFTSSASDMTWTYVSEYETVGTDAKACKLGEGDKWVLTYDLYGIGGTGWNFFGAYVGGENQLVGIELAGSTYKAIGYYAGVDKPFMLSAEVGALLRGATDDAPVTAVYIRDGATIKMLLKTAEKTYVIATWDFETFGVTGNSFGIGERQGPTNATLKNIEFISSAGKLGLYKETIKATIDTTNVTIEDKQYYIGDTVTLTAAAAPTGQMFSHFTVDNEKIPGNTFVVTASDHSVKAIYTAAATLTLAEGITVNGESGVVKVAKDSEVTLAYTGTVADGKVVDYFTAGGMRIYNGTFVPTTDAYEIGVVFANASEYTWGAKENGGYEEASYGIDGASGTAAVWKDWGFQGEIFGKSEYWAIEVKTDTPKNASGGNEWGSIDFIIGDKESLRIRVNGTTYFGIYARQNGSSDEFYPSGHNEFYPAYVNGSSDDRRAHAAAIAGGVNAFTCVRNGDTVMLFIGNELIFTTEYKFNRTAGEDWFGVAAVADGSADKAAMPTNDTKFIVGQDKINALLASKQATIACDKVTIDKTVYYIGDTVTLTAAAAPDGQIFSHFTVDNEKIPGNTFVVTASNHSVKAIYTDAATLTLGEGITVNGESGVVKVAKDSEVTLAYTGAVADGKVVDYFVVDAGTENEQRVYNGAFIATASTHSVTAVLVEPENMTWANGEEASYSIDGASGTAAVWKDWGFQGEIFGKSEYWAIEVKTDTPKNASGGNEWGSIDFIIGDKESLRIRVNGTTYFGIYARQNGSSAEFYPSGHNEFYPAYVNNSSDDRKAHAAAIAGGVNAFTCVRNGDTVMLFIGNELIFTTEYKFNRTAGEDWFGVAAVADGSADKAAMPTNDTKFIVGQDKVNALLNALENA